MFLSVAGSGTCCSAVSRGSDGGGSDCVPAMTVSVRLVAIVSIQCNEDIWDVVSMLNFGIGVFEPRKSSTN